MPFMRRCFTFTCWSCASFWILGFNLIKPQVSHRSIKIVCVIHILWSLSLIHFSDCWKWLRVSYSKYCCLYTFLMQNNKHRSNKVLLFQYLDHIHWSTYPLMYINEKIKHYLTLTTLYWPLIQSFFSFLQLRLSF